MRRLQRIAWSLACAIWCAAAGPVPAGSQPAPGRPNVLLITLDTTRADRIGAYGCDFPTSPNLDALAARGLRFATAVSQVPLTGPSHATIMTGRYPHEHGAVRNGVPLPEKAVTLAERLQEAGYRTAAFVSGWTLRANLSGLFQGFDHYDDRMQDRYHLVNTQRFAHQVTPAAIEWLETGGEGPFFLWVHYFDPHGPYRKNPEYFASLTPEQSEAAFALPERLRKYDSEIFHMDAWIGELLTSLRRLDLERSTIVMVAGDHGESLGEHGYVGHGRHLYEEILHVPMMVSWPGVIPEGHTVQAPVALLDVAPTLLGLLDLPAGEALEGLDLSELAKGADVEEHYTGRQIRFATYPGARKGIWKIFSPRVSSMPTMVGYREGVMKVVFHVDDEQAEVFDLSDQGEKQDLIDRYPTLNLSGRRLVRWIESTSTDAEEVELTPEDAEALRSLGYN